MLGDAGHDADSEIVAQPDEQMHERAVEHRIAFAQQRDVAAGFEMRGDCDRPFLVEARQRLAIVSGGRQQDVSAGLVRLRLEREAHAVALVENVGAEDVVGLLAPVQRGPDVLGRAGLRAVAPAQHT